MLQVPVFCNTRVREAGSVFQNTLGGRACASSLRHRSRTSGIVSPQGLPSPHKRNNWHDRARRNQIRERE